MRHRQLTYSVQAVFVAVLLSACVSHTSNVYQPPRPEFAAPVNGRCESLGRMSFLTIGEWSYR